MKFERMQIYPGGWGWWGYAHQFRIGVCRQGSQTLTLFQGRKSRFDTLFKAQTQEVAPDMALSVPLKSLC